MTVPFSDYFVENMTFAKFVKTSVEICQLFDDVIDGGGAFNSVFANASNESVCDYERHHRRIAKVLTIY